MRALHVAFHALWTEHAPVEGKFLPWLESNDFVVPDFQLNAALLAAETAVCLYQFFRRIAGFTFPPARGFVLQVGPVTLNKCSFVNRRPCHDRIFSKCDFRRRQSMVIFRKHEESIR